VEPKHTSVSKARQRIPQHRGTFAGKDESFTGKDESFTGKRKRACHFFFENERGCCLLKKN
jgi:hypothetical protein